MKIFVCCIASEKRLYLASRLRDGKDDAIAVQWGSETRLRWASSARFAGSKSSSEKIIAKWTWCGVLRSAEPSWGYQFSVVKGVDTCTQVFDSHFAISDLRSLFFNASHFRVYVMFHVPNMCGHVQTSTRHHRPFCALRSPPPGSLASISAARCLAATAALLWGDADLVAAVGAARVDRASCAPCRAACYHGCACAHSPCCCSPGRGWRCSSRARRSRCRAPP